MVHKFPLTKFLMWEKSHVNESCQGEKSDTLLKRANQTEAAGFGRQQVWKNKTKLKYMAFWLQGLGHTQSHYKDSAWELETRLNWSGAKLHHFCHGRLGLWQTMVPFICIFSQFPSSKGAGRLFSTDLFDSSFHK